jgi:hypothetical protein
VLVLGLLLLASGLGEGGTDELGVTSELDAEHSLELGQEGGRGDCTGGRSSG